MSTNPLEYEAPHGARPPQRIWARRRLAWLPWRRVLAGVLLVGGVLALFTAPVRTVERNVDRITGSEMTQTTWFGAIKGSTTYNASALELRLKQSSITWTPAWQRITHRRCNVLGDTLESGHGSALPPICHVGR